MVEKLILLVAGQAIAGILAVIKLWYSNDRLKERVRELEESRKEMLKELKDANTKLTTLTSHVELLLLGKIKTANNR